MQITNVTEDAEVFTANAYLVEGEVTALIDVGTPSAVVETIASTTDDVDAVYLTHTHGDHIEQLDAVVEAFDPAVYAFGDFHGATASIADGDTVDVGDHTLTALHTPGHADDHLVFYDASVMFSGDVVVYNDGAYDDGSFGRTDLPGQSRERLIDSIERIHRRVPQSVESMYPGHGDRYVGDVHAVIERALTRARRREPKYPE